MLVCLFGGMVMKPGPVLGTQRLIGPPKEVALFLGTGPKQPIGVGGGMALLKRGWFTAKALQTTPHVTHFWMRLTIHGFLIVRGLVLPTKQKTRLNGTFDIVPSLLRLTGLQTHVVARAHHGVHRTRWRGVFGFSQGFCIVIHVRQCELRRGVWVDWSIMSFNSFIISSTAALVSSTTSRTTGSQSSGVIC